MKKNKLLVIIKRCVISFVVLGLVYAGAMFFLMQSGARNVPEPGADTLLVLGAKVWGDVDNPEPSPVLKERLDQALVYLADNPSTVVVVAGGQGSDEPISEAQAMATYLLDNGIDAKRIRLEDKSTTTQENISNSMAMFPMGKTVIVSNDYHVYRAVLTAKRLGLPDVEGLGAVSRSGSTLKSTVREVIALGYHLIFSR